MDFCLTSCCEIVEKLEAKINQERINNTCDEILELYEELLMETYRFIEKNMEEFSSTSN